MPYGPLPDRKQEPARPHGPATGPPAGSPPNTPAQPPRGPPAGPPTPPPPVADPAVPWPVQVEAASWPGSWPADAPQPAPSFAADPKRPVPALAASALTLGLVTLLAGWVPILGIVFALTTLGLAIPAIAAPRRQPSRRGLGMALTATTLAALMLAVAIAMTAFTFNGFPWSQPPDVGFAVEDTPGPGGAIVVVSVQGKAGWGGLDARDRDAGCLVPAQGRILPGDRVVCREDGEATLFHASSDTDLFSARFGP